MNVLETTRRGFLGLLGGLLLGGKLIGPKLIAEPTAEAWEAARRLPPRPVINTYVPLEIVSAEVLRIVDEETRWLRLQRHMSTAMPGCGYFPPFAIREASFLRYPLSCDRFGMIERRTVVHNVEHAGVAIDLRDVDYDCPMGFLSAQHVRPAALELAEKVIHLVRLHGGAEHIVFADLENRPEAQRCIVSRSERASLSIRATESVQPEYETRWPHSRFPDTLSGGHQVGWKSMVHIDCRFGLA